MVDPTTRLAEARKQIQLTADELEEEALVEELQKADVILETVRGEIVEGDP